MEIDLPQHLSGAADGSAGAGKLDAGAGALSEGNTQLADGLATLSNCSTELAAGTSKLEANTQAVSVAKISTGPSAALLQIPLGLLLIPAALMIRNRRHLRG